MYPAVAGEGKALQLFAEVFHHVVAFGLAVYQYVQTQLVLALHGAGDLRANLRHVLLLVHPALFVLTPQAADLGGLRKGADGGGGIEGKLQPLALQGSALGIGMRALVHVLLYGLAALMDFGAMNAR